MNPKSFLFFFSITFLLYGCQEKSDNISTLEGAWKIVSSEILIPDGSVRTGHVQENLILFSKGFYSMCSAGGQEKSPYYQERFKPTSEEKLARYDKLLINSGKYSVSGNELTIHPDFALFPEFVGGLGVFDFSVSKDSLQLIWHKIVSVDGINDPYIEMGVRWRYQLVRME